MGHVCNFYFGHPEYIDLISIRLSGSFSSLFQQKSDWLSGVFAIFCVCKSVFPGRLHLVEPVHIAVLCARSCHCPVLVAVWVEERYTSTHS